MLLYYIRTYQLDSNSIRSFFEVLILVSEGPPSFSVANLPNPLQTVSTGMQTVANRLYGMLRHLEPGSSPGAAQEQPGAAQEPPGAAQK